VNLHGSRTVEVPLLDLKMQYRSIKPDVDEAISRVVESQYFILGEEVSGFEAEIAAYCGVSYGVGMSSGTDALLAALMALEVGPGDDIILPTYTFFATGGVVARLGATPVFVDIDPVTCNVLPESIAAAVTPRTRAVIPVHLYGRMADMDGVTRAVADKGIAIVEDAAQAIGSFDAKGRKAGSVAGMGCFSFFPSKNLGGFGDAGMTVTNDSLTAGRLKMLRMHGMEPKYYHSLVGGNFRLDALQAAVLRVKMRYLEQWNAGRRRNAERYRELFAMTELEGTVSLPHDDPGHVYNQFVIRVEQRDALQAHLRAHGVGTEIYYPVPLHLQKCFAWLGYAEGTLPNAEVAARETLALPIYPELTDEQLEYVVATVARFYGA
jgi:dTDP-4-amino-4,6-dideoxygalactose transaminase